MDEDVSVVCLAKGEERYFWFFVDRTRWAVLRSIGRMAADAELSLTWMDAATLCKRVQEMGEGDGVP